MESTSDTQTLPSTRILLAVAGLTPQIVTETLYAIAMQEGVEALPNRVRLLTTSEGAERARLTLLSEAPGWFGRLLRDYDLPPLEFQPSDIGVFRDAAGEPLFDIRTPEDNERCADLITETVRDLTADPDSALHVSIAGGRKTMGFYAGYALSLFGRPQDRLSHVLVSPRYESHPDFYYPTPYSRIIHTPPPDSRPMDTRDATVDLAHIPFVSLRHGLTDQLVKGGATFSTAVAAARQALGPPRLVIDLANRAIEASGVECKLPPFQLTFLVWFAERRQAGQTGLRCPAEGAPEASYAQEYLTLYRRILGEMGDDDRTVRRLAKGMEKSFFQETKAKLHKSLKSRLGPAAPVYLIKGEGKRPQRFGLTVPGEAIGWVN